MEVRAEAAGSAALSERILSSLAPVCSVWLSTGLVLPTFTL